MDLSIPQLLRKYGLQAKKSWGQNFLLDERAYEEILRAAAPEPMSWVVEIGAGLGTLTRRLAERAGRVIAIERDRELIPVLKGELGELAQVEIAEANALTFDYRAVARGAGRKLIAVGNLPYQIASPLLFRLLDARACLERIVVMLQWEMARRIVGPPGTKEYGALTVMIGALARAEIARRVAPGSFYPRPSVVSAIVVLTPRSEPLIEEAELPRLREIVQASFGRRRKTLRNALGVLGSPAQVEDALARAGLDGGRRGETLEIEDFVRLALVWPQGLPDSRAGSGGDAGGEPVLS